MPKNEENEEGEERASFVNSTLSVILKISEHGICVTLCPEFNEFNPIFEIDIKNNILIQGKKIGYINEYREVIFC